nr:hypothetical protein [Sodalis-like endosymbiont of Proechinophthirus fluctus]
MLGPFGILTTLPLCLQGNVRVLTDGRDLNLTNSFYLAPREFAQSYVPFVSDVLARFSQADKLLPAATVTPVSIFWSTHPWTAQIGDRPLS